MTKEYASTALGVALYAHDSYRRLSLVKPNSTTAQAHYDGMRQAYKNVCCNFLRRNPFTTDIDKIEFLLNEIWKGGRHGK